MFNIVYCLNLSKVFRTLSIILIFNRIRDKNIIIIIESSKIHMFFKLRSYELGSFGKLLKIVRQLLYFEFAEFMNI